ncbi:MAG: fatty acid cis/trans isomerase [Bdellovibrionota bacterium]
MENRIIGFIAIVSLLIATCAPVRKGELKYLAKRVDQSAGGQFYLDHVEPVLNSRCAVCHACYDSPCELNLSSPEGLARGLIKRDSYDNRLFDSEPLRMFIDHSNTEGWRRLGFSSVIGDETNTYKPKGSLLKAVLDQKSKYPQVQEAVYDSFSSRICPTYVQIENNRALQKTPKGAKHLFPKLGGYASVVKTFRHLGMPYGFPELSPDERENIYKWLEVYKAELPTTDTFSYFDVEAILKWEDFFNNVPSGVDVFKHQLTMKYLYEHLFIAHINFHSEIEKHLSSSSEYYRLVRSRTPSGKNIEEIPTRLPTDKIEGKFYYRFKKITSLIVEKTHIVYHLTDKKILRYKELFLSSEWIKDQDGDYLGYKKSKELFSDAKIYTNPYSSFAPIPPFSRYAFMLDNAEFFVRSFIRGPVCRGGIAINVINDHFWIFFVDPQKDLLVDNETLLFDYKNLLKVPALEDDFKNIVHSSLLLYRKDVNDFWAKRKELYTAQYPNGLSTDVVWRGDGVNHNALLTVYRHFDSASVVRGLRGRLPKTAWLIDYPTFESIYYNLVVGFDLYASIFKQINNRLYMETSRISSEDMFLNLMSTDNRLAMRRYWSRDAANRNDAAKNEEIYPFESIGGKVLNRNIAHASREENESIIKSTTLEIMKGISSEILKESNLDGLNCPDCIDYDPSSEFEVQARLALDQISGVSLEKFPEVSFVRVRSKDQKSSQWYTLIKNVAHFNVASVFSEEARLDPLNNQLEVHRGFLGAYPNLFFSLNEGEEKSFFEILVRENNVQLNPYVIGRYHKDFWSFYDDAVQAHLDGAYGQGHLGGVFDLGRYLNIFNR